MRFRGGGGVALLLFVVRGRHGRWRQRDMRLALCGKRTTAVLVFEHFHPAAFHPHKELMLQQQK
jgi:hypothetical protein